MKVWRKNEAVHIRGKTANFHTEGGGGERERVLRVSLL